MLTIAAVETIHMKTTKILAIEPDDPRILAMAAAIEAQAMVEVAVEKAKQDIHRGDE